MVLAKAHPRKSALPASRARWSKMPSNWSPDGALDLGVRREFEGARDRDHDGGRRRLSPATAIPPLRGKSPGDRVSRTS